MLVDRERFIIARASAVSFGDGGIGTYGEKILHRTLKYYFESDDSNHEIPYLGAVADIMNDSGIIEIQTAAMARLKDKLERFLPSTKVTVVYPLIRNKTIIRIDSESGEVLPPRKSSRRGRLSDALGELSAIRGFIEDENLSIKIVVLDACETRMTSRLRRVGRKRTAKINIMPQELVDILSLDNAWDYIPFIPEGLGEVFGSKEFEKISGLRGVKAHGAIMLLLQLGLLKREKVGKAYQYSITITR